jgi:hypothetical protein
MPTGAELSTPLAMKSLCPCANGVKRHSAGQRLGWLVGEKTASLIERSVGRYDVACCGRSRL